MRSRASGFTLLEVLVASVIAAVIAGGTMMAFVTAARIGSQQSNPMMAEASGYAQQTLERFRNRVAANSPWPASEADGVWRTDALPAAGGTESMLNIGGVVARRCYRVTPEDCDGDGLRADPVTPGEQDCYAVDAKVCWRDLAGCPCP